MTVSHIKLDENSFLISLSSHSCLNLLYTFPKVCEWYVVSRHLITTLSRNSLFKLNLTQHINRLSKALGNPFLFLSNRLMIFVGLTLIIKMKQQLTKQEDKSLH